MHAMSFTHEIFISYGWLDDEDPAGEFKGWVDLLVERLPRLINNNLGYQPKIWRDERSLRGNDRLKAAIDDGVSQSLIFVPIVSPRYVQSEWCRLELEKFCSIPFPAELGHRSRIFKVIKTPLLFHLANNEPKQLRDLVGYSFYEMEGEMPVEFSPDTGQNKDMRYWTALRRLAFDISQMLAGLKHSTQSPAPEPDGRKFIYLAETASDLTKERELVRDELLQRGYGVLPDQKLPLDQRKRTQDAVKAALAQCVLSVHMIGEKYGLTPEDDARSLVGIQEELTAEHGAADPKFLRLVWMPQGLMTPEVEIADERQKTFITGLQNRICPGTELLQTSIEDLKTRINEKLNPPSTLTKQNGRSKLKQVYLICEVRDRNPVKPIKEFLFKENLEVITWLDGDPTSPMEYHRKNLKECDAALVYFGNGDEPWVRKNLEDLEKAYGYGRENDWTASAVYVGGPRNYQKEDFLTHLVRFVITNFDSFQPTDLHDFLTAVRDAKGGER